MINTRKTKIVAKIADNNSDSDFLRKVFSSEHGADVAWLNTAHQDEAQTLEVIEKIRSVSGDLFHPYRYSLSIPILLDTKGPEIRTKNIEQPFEVRAGDKITFTGDITVVGENVVHVTYPNFHNEVPIGVWILYDDASIGTVVEEKTAEGLVCRVKNGGIIKNKKSLNIPDVHIQLPALSDKDRGFIHFSARHNIDFIIHSFVRNKEDIFEIKDILKDYPDYAGKILAKIENREGFNHVEEILEHCEGLMVARGDLGAEVPFEELPYMQKKMLEACVRMGKYCIVATQVLDSMIHNPRPTRAEVTDVANAVLDGSGAVSMSGETAYGEYPLEAIEVMGRIMKYTEDKRAELVHFEVAPEGTVTQKIEMKAAKEICTLAEEHAARCIFVCTKDIEIVRAISAYRPSALVIATCLREEDARELMLAYAVRPVVVGEISLEALTAVVRDTVPFESGDVVVLVQEEGEGYSKKVTTFGEISVG